MTTETIKAPSITGTRQKIMEELKGKFDYFSQRAKVLSEDISEGIGQAEFPGCDLMGDFVLVNIQAKVYQEALLEVDNSGLDGEELIQFLTKLARDKAYSAHTWNNKMDMTYIEYTSNIWEGLTKL